MKIVILAAGRGKRMGSLTDDLPKPMLPVQGRPLLEHVLDRAREAGCTAACLVVGYRAEVIRGHFAGYPLPIEYRLQEVVDGTARAALLARDFAGPDPFLLTFGDILTEPASYQSLMGLLTNDGETQGALAVNWVEDPTRGAAVYCDGDCREGERLVRIEEKPAPGTSTTHWNSAGIYAFRPAIFDELARVPRSPRGEYELTSAIAQCLEAGKVVRVHQVRGPWRDVGRPEDLTAANQG